MPIPRAICRGAPKVTSKTVSGFVGCTATACCGAPFGLQGNWQEELLFDLRIALENYEHFQKQIAAYNQQICQELNTLPSKVDVHNQPLAASRPKACHA